MPISKAQLFGWTIMVVIATMALTTAFQVWADGDSTTDDVPRMIPYQGQIDMNGQAVNATGEEALMIRFVLYDGPGEEAPVVYSQQQNVEVFNGRFTTTIGPLGENGASIQDVVSAADDLRLGMTLIDASDGSEITMSGRQRLMATPYALWSTSAANFNVARNLSVGGNLAVDGAAVLGGDVDIEGNTRLAGELDVAGQLHNGDGALNLGGDVDVAGELDVGGVFNADSATLETSLTIGSTGSRLNGIMHGSHCPSSGNATQSVTFPNGGFSNTPRIWLQPIEPDASGCVTTRLTNRSGTGFTYQGYVGGSLTRCQCVYWMAIGL